MEKECKGAPRNSLGYPDIGISSKYSYLTNTKWSPCTKYASAPNDAQQQRHLLNIPSIND